MRTINITETILLSSLDKANDYAKENNINTIFGYIVPINKITETDIAKTVQNGYITGRILQQDTTILRDSLTREIGDNILGKMV